MYAIRSYYVFMGLDIETISNVLNDIHYQIKKYSAGQIVVLAEQPVDRLFIVLSGGVKGEMIDFSGKTIKIEDIDPPKPLAIAFMFGKANTYPVNIITNKPSELLVIPRITSYNVCYTKLLRMQKISSG